MSQNALSIANVAGALYRAGVNSALDTLLNLNSGAAAPGTTQAGMLWCDTANGVVKQRNAANSGWITRWTVANAEGVSNADINIGAGKFTVAAATGNTAIGGTLYSSGLITSTVGNNLPFQSSASATTGFNYLNVSNTSGALAQFGVNGVTANAIFVNGLALDGWIAFANGKGFEIGESGGNVKMRVSSAGLAVSQLTDDVGNLIVSSTNPTIASGFGAGAAILANNTAAFRVTIGTGSPTAGQITMPAAPNGWSCQITHFENSIGNLPVMEANLSNATTIYVVNLNRATGALLPLTAGDHLIFQCIPY